MRPGSAASLVAAVSALVLLGSPAPGAGQAQPSTGAIPRTPEGIPDLQGNWSNSTLTPFQREEGRGPVFTWEEVAALEQGLDGCPPNPGTVECGREDNQDDASLSNEVRLRGAEYNEVYWERGTRIAIVNGEPRTSLVTQPRDGRIPARTEAAQLALRERQEFRSRFEPYDHVELRPFAERCILFGSPSGPPMTPVGAYNSNYVIVQTPDHVMIMSEMVHDVRIIRLGDPNPLPKHVRPYFGDSWGRWEGDTLVVETTHYRDDTTWRGFPGTRDLRAVERFTRIDEDTIDYRYTIHDEATYTRPFTVQLPLNRPPGYVIYEYACHEGNYSIANALAGERVLEAAGRRSP